MGDGVLLEVENNEFLPQIDDSVTIKSIAGGVFTGLAEEQKENCYCPYYCDSMAHYGTSLSSIDKSLLERYFRDLIYIGSNNFNYMDLSAECTIDLEKIEYLGDRTFVNCKDLKLKYNDKISEIAQLEVYVSFDGDIYSSNIYPHSNNVLEEYAQSKPTAISDISKIFYCDHLIVEQEYNMPGEPYHELHSAINRESYKCEICGQDCNHQVFDYWANPNKCYRSAVYSDGTCLLCGQICNHISATPYNGKLNCGMCGYQCTWHEVQPKEGVCFNCNYHCANHQMQSDGSNVMCYNCGAICTAHSLNWEARCENCGYQCYSHYIDPSGFCPYCSFQCPNHSVDSGGYCPDCGFQCPNHSDGNGDSSCDSCNNYISMW